MLNTHHFLCTCHCNTATSFLEFAPTTREATHAAPSAIASGSGITRLSFAGTNATVVINNLVNTTWFDLNNCTVVFFYGLNITVIAKKITLFSICNSKMIEMNYISLECAGSCKVLIQDTDNGNVSFSNTALQPLSDS